MTTNAARSADHDVRIARFHAYAAAFEAAYERDDWRLLAPYFTETATSELNGANIAGRDAVIASLRDSVATFDRRFDRRALRLTAGPTVEPDGRLHVTAVVRYERAGLDPLEVVGEEWFTFDGDRIAAHVDQVTNLAEVMAYLGSHLERLRPVGAS